MHLHRYIRIFEDANMGSDTDSGDVDRREHGPWHHDARHHRPEKLRTPTDTSGGGNGMTRAANATDAAAADLSRPAVATGREG